MPDPGSKTMPPTRLDMWGALASILLAVSFIVGPVMYLTGNLRSAHGPLSYHLADLVSGPIWGASLVTAVVALRERLGAGAPRRMDMAVIAAALSAAFILAASLFRSTNRQYHLAHPELALEHSPVVLLEWTLTIGGVTATGMHLLGWTLVLLASAAWTTGELWRPLAVAYGAAGLAALMLYLFPSQEGLVVLLGIVWAIWQGVLLLRPGGRG